MAFQTGETLALLSSNHFEATPHFVNAASSTLSSAALARIRQQIDDDPNWANVRDGSVSRETLAVFIQVRRSSRGPRNYSVLFVIPAESRGSRFEVWRDVRRVYEESTPATLRCGVVELISVAATKISPHQLSTFSANPLLFSSKSFLDFQFDTKTRFDDS